VKDDYGLTASVDIWKKNICRRKMRHCVAYEFLRPIYTSEVSGDVEGDGDVRHLHTRV